MKKKKKIILQINLEIKKERMQKLKNNKKFIFLYYLIYDRSFEDSNEKNYRLTEKIHMK